MSFSLVKDEKSGLTFYKSSLISDCGANALFMTRSGGVSGVFDGRNTASVRGLNLGHTHSDTAENITENYRLAAIALNTIPEKIINARQRHTDFIYIPSGSEPAGKFGMAYLEETADAMVTDKCGVVLSVRTADCVPILFHEKSRGVIAAAHCGWRGTIQSLQVKSAYKLRELYGADLSVLTAVIGPSISVCCYEVTAQFRTNFINTLGVEVAEYFRAKYNGRYLCDLKGINKHLLLRAGLVRENIDTSGECTFCNTDLFYSHRRDGDCRGTMAAFIMLK